MTQTRSFNADIASSIAEFHSLMRGFELKKKLYRVLVRGKGVDFEGYRDYTRDDDSNLIDWKASKRTNKLIIKQYQEERNRKVLFIIDVSENMIFGSEKKLKCEYAAEVVGAFIHFIITTRDRCGILLFSDSIKKFIPPLGGIQQFHYCVASITDPLIYGGRANLADALEYVLTYVQSSLVSIILVSDFLVVNEKAKRNLSFIAKKFETLALRIKDKLDYTLPDIAAEIVIEDSKTGQQLLVNPKVARQMYERIVRKQTEELSQLCREGHIDLINLSTAEPFAPHLAEFLKERTREVI